MPDVNKQSPAGAYDPSTHRMLSFHGAVAKFRDGSDTPRTYLERCIECIETLESAVMAFAFLNLDRARETADESGARYKSGRPLGVVSGIPAAARQIRVLRHSLGAGVSIRRPDPLAG